MDFITIDSVPLPAPANNGFSISNSDLDTENSSRSQSGYLRRQRIRQGVYKLNIIWIVSQSQLATIVTAISPESFSCTFYDGTTNTYKTCTMYAGDKEVSLKIRKNIDDNSLWELKVNLIEY